MKKLAAILFMGALLFGCGVMVFAAGSELPRTVPGEKSGDDTFRWKEAPVDPRYACPSTRYVNCMPPLDKSDRGRCDPEYLRWVKSHCPAVEVVY